MNILIHIFFAIPIQKATVQKFSFFHYQMLFVGDIHITSKHATAILGQIRTMIDTHPEEQHIIFLGDYVYHFTYDRKALLQLFGLFIDLATNGKHIYILAGNHDRIAGHFVFEEARQTLLFTKSTQIHFITEPTFFTIEGVRCLFFPYHYPQHDEEMTDDTFPHLQEHTNPQRQLSWKINNLLMHYLTSRKQTASTDRLLLIHHRYIANTKFPGQQATFSYDSPALDPFFLTFPGVWSISGHLHEAFCTHTYLCTGSIWHTSPLEVNQQKFMYTLDPATRNITAHPCPYNPYLQLPYPDKPLTKEIILGEMDQHQSRIADQLQNGQRTVNVNQTTRDDLSHTTITLTTDQHALENLPAAFDQTVIKEIAAIKHKLIQNTTSSLVDDLDRAALDLTTRFSDWKTLLKRFLEQKYGAGAERYLQLLAQEDLLS